MEGRSAEEVAKLLAGFYKERFYGKENSKYRINKDQIKYLAGKPKLDAGYMKQTKEELRKRGYVWVKIVDNYIIFEETPLHRCRAIKNEKIDELIGKKKAKESSPGKRTTKKVKRKRE